LVIFNSIGDKMAQRNNMQNNYTMLKETISKGEDPEKIVDSILNNIKNEISDLDRMMYKEIALLSKYIKDARSNIANIPYEIRNKDIPNATDELDAVVVATEDATAKILDAAEQIEKVGSHSDLEQSSQLTDAVTQIYEACSFQDITGQRIAKVVQTLKHIESQLEHLFDIYSKGIVDTLGSALGSTDDDLMIGPQLPKNAKNQDEIDKLFGA
jgi:chemotaxis protein CheZ